MTEMTPNEKTFRAEITRAQKIVGELKREREQLIYAQTKIQRLLFALLDMPGMPERVNQAISRTLKETRKP